MSPGILEGGESRNAILSWPECHFVFFSPVFLLFFFYCSLDFGVFSFFSPRL